MRQNETPTFVRNLTLYALAALLVAGANATQLALRLNPHLRVITRLRVHAYDVALFLLLGCCAAVTVSCWQLGARRWRSSTLWRVAVVAQVLVGGYLGGALLANDFANFVGKQNLAVPPSAFGAAVGAIAATGLAFGLRHVSTSAHRQIVGSVALLLAAYNALLLPSGYPGIHPRSGPPGPSGRKDRQCPRDVGIGSELRGWAWLQ